MPKYHLLVSNNGINRTFGVAVMDENLNILRSINTFDARRSVVLNGYYFVIDTTADELVKLDPNTLTELGRTSSSQVFKTAVATDGQYLYCSDDSDAGQIYQIDPDTMNATAFKKPNSNDAQDLHAVDGFLYGADNTGATWCIKISTKELEWEQDTSGYTRAVAKVGNYVFDGRDNGDVRRYDAVTGSSSDHLAFGSDVVGIAHQPSEDGNHIYANGWDATKKIKVSDMTAVATAVQADGGAGIVYANGYVYAGDGNALKLYKMRESDLAVVDEVVTATDTGTNLDGITLIEVKESGNALMFAANF